jgi:bacterioferritin-associated ferredoxin
MISDKHITEVLDNSALASLTPGELAEIGAHASECASCERAFVAAQASAAVIKERAQVVIEPTPFFQTRVMAALREQQAVESVPAFLRLWRSSRALVSSMALTTAALAAVSFMVSAPATTGLDQTQTVSAYSVDSVMFEQGGDDQLTYDQVLNAIYTDDEEK